MTTTCIGESTVAPCVLLIAFELGQRTWKLGFSRGIAERPRVRSVRGGDVEAVAREIAKTKQLWQLDDRTRVVSCYEAGRDGFWLHRWLVAQGITNYVVDSASIEVNRRAKRTKTDQLDLVGLLTSLARYVWGDRRVWRVVRVPTVAPEDGRHWHRSREIVLRDRTRVINRIKALLATLGTPLPVRGDFLEAVTQARLWDGRELPPGARERLRREWTQLQEITGHLRALECVGARPALDDATTATGIKLEQLRAIGPASARTLATELFGWREIRNARQLGALVGLVPARYQSGERSCDLGITRAGNVHVRRLSSELAWVWVQYQPQSALARWYRERFGGGSPRVRRIGIVAVARKLLIALWRYVDRGVVPDGAVLKPSV
jgi:transposase